MRMADKAIAVQHCVNARLFAIRVIRFSCWITYRRESGSFDARMDRGRRIEGAADQLSVLVKIVGQNDGKEMRRMSSGRGSFGCLVAVRAEIGADRRSHLSGNLRAFNRPR